MGRLDLGRNLLGIYVPPLSWPSIRQRTDIEAVLLILVSIAIGLSYFAVYLLGEIRGVANMKRTQLFITGMHMGDTSARLRSTGDHPDQTAHAK